jgi:predicted transcriptional regulator
MTDGAVQFRWPAEKDTGKRLGRRDFEMSSLPEIQEAIEKLASEDRARLREWFDAQDVEETDELLAAIDKGIRSAETERTFSLEEVRAEIKKWATKSA